jgi:capsular polysaccharide biosynthesis protein
MELRMYLRILSKKWWLVLTTFLVTYGATLAYTYYQQPMYRSRATFVVKLNSDFTNDRDLASAVDVLSRRTEIATTYTIVANSHMIRRAAATALGLSGHERNDVTVSSEIIPGTNVLEITADSSNPALARDFTDAIGTQTVAYVQDLYETYRLEPLDAASVPEAPVAPNRQLNLALGAIVGLILGCGLALLATYLQAPISTSEARPRVEPASAASSRQVPEKQPDFASA